MHTDNESSKHSAEAIMESAEDSGEKNLQWLLDIELDEPEEKLFSLAGEDQADTGLTEYEAAVAARPMFRGNAGADDFDNYVAEEIVISSDGAAGDIYSSSDAVAEEDPGSTGSEAMAVDYSRRKTTGPVAGTVSDVDGVDILGISDEDDLGGRVPAAVGAEACNAGETPVDTVEAVVETVEIAADGEQEQDITGSGDIETTVSGQDAAEMEWPEAGLEAVCSDMDAILGDAEEFGWEASDATENVALETEAVEPEQQVEQDPAITPAVSLVVEELLAAVRDVLEAKSRPADSVRVEVMLGSDDESVAQWQAQGYEPLLSVCEEPVPALQGLRQTDVDALYVRLVEVESGAIVNGLMRVEPELDEEALAEELLGADDLAGFGEEAEGVSESAEIIKVQFDNAQQEAAADSVFDDDIFADDLSFDLPEPEAGAATDIDAMFDSLEQPEEMEVDVDSEIELAADENLDGSEFTSVDPAAPQGTEMKAVKEPEAVEPEVSVDAVQEPESVAPIDAGAQGQDGDMSWCIPAGIEFNYTSQSGAEIFADFLDAFLEEGASELEKLEDAVSEWEQDITADAAFATVTRTLHTLKGIAKGVGLQRYGTLVHNYETLLEAMPLPEAGAEHAYFRIVNAWLDAAVRGLDHIREQRSDIASELPGRVQVAADGEVAAEQVEAGQAGDDRVDQPVMAPESEESREQRRQLDKQLADEGAKVLAAQQSVRITSEKLDHLLNLANQAQQLGVRTAQGTARGKRASSELQARLSSVRTQISEIADRSLLSVPARGDRANQELDALEMDQYSELQEAANILREGIEDIADLVDMASRQTVQVEALLKQQASVISSIGSSIQAARVVPVSRLVPGLRRIVRTVSSDLNKSVKVKVLNEVGSLERDDYARCQTILEHMVRNALDHGIESPEQRMAAGKDTTGQITLDVRKSGADYLVTLADDGRGIDPAKMRESARSKGLDLDVDSLSDEEAMRLIFHKGLSTARELSEISGRGVGMDIVLSELQQMGGDIQIKSELGLGTTFTIRIPANVTVNGALLVTAGDSSYAIPLGGLVGVEHVDVGDFFDAIEQGGTISLSGMECKPAYLATLCEGTSMPDRSELGSSLPVILAGSAPNYMAIAIDDVEEALELVIRNLGPQFSSVPGVAGAATSANGEAVVALDLNLLVQDAVTAGGSSVALETERKEELLVMVVDDSRTQRMVTTSQLDTVGVESFTAENGVVAIDLLNSAQRLPDIILMDVEMPHKDGIQALREIRKSHRYGHIPVIMITSRTGLKHRSLAEEAGCNGYMGKPFNFRMLIAQINQLTGHSLQLS